MVKKAITVCGAWLVLGAFLWFILPEEFKWIAYIPIALPPLAATITIVIIIFQKFDYLKPRAPPIIRGKTITQCFSCPYGVVVPNVVSESFPIVKCGDAGGRTNYTPDKIPRWCPYAK